MVPVVDTRGPTRPRFRGNAEDPKKMSASAKRQLLGLSEKSIDFDFAARAEIDSAIDHDWDYETRG